MWQLFSHMRGCTALILQGGRLEGATQVVAPERGAPTFQQCCCLRWVLCHISHVLHSSGLGAELGAFTVRCIESMHALPAPHIFQQLKRCLPGWLACIHTPSACFGGEGRCQRGFCCGNRKTRGQPCVSAPAPVFCGCQGCEPRLPCFCSQQAAASWQQGTCSCVNQTLLALG
jgi:hypothetical protein